MKEIVWYLAGKMSGIPQFNFPLFDRVAKLLRDVGFKVISPAELDDAEVREQAMASETGNPISETNQLNNRSWGDFLSRDVKIVADEVEGIFLLEGWEHSRGARLEAFVGILCGHKFMTVKTYDESIDIVNIDASEVKSKL